MHFHKNNTRDWMVVYVYFLFGVLVVGHFDFGGLSGFGFFGVSAFFVIVWLGSLVAILDIVGCVDEFMKKLIKKGGEGI